MTRRSKTRYPGFDKGTSLKVRQELLDQDYIEKLSETEKLMVI